MHLNRVYAINQFKSELTDMSIDRKTNQHIIYPTRHLKLHNFLIVVTPGNYKRTALT